RGTQLREAEELIRRILDRDPALEARLRFRVAQTLMSLHDYARQDAGRVMARRVWELDQRAIGPRWQLTREQRYGVRRWLGMPLESGERQVWVLIPLAAGPLGGGSALMPIVVNVPVPLGGRSRRNKI